MEFVDDEAQPKNKITSIKNFYHLNSNEIDEKNIRKNFKKKI